MDSAYRYEAASIAGLLQQLVLYVSKGYFFYVQGRIPEHKDPAATDEKLLHRYGIAVSKWSRARRKRAGEANIQYLRHGHRFILLATHGEHRFFAEEESAIRDLRRVPLKAFGYAVSFRRNRVCVRIEREEFKGLKAHLLEQAVRRTSEELQTEIYTLPFEPYAPVRQQIRQLWRAVNKARRLAGSEPLDPSCLRYERTIVRPFEASETA